MNQKEFDKAILFVLRYAIEHDGVASYNPCMYHLGYADNIPPSEEFNNELKKYGSLEYSRNLDEYSYLNHISSWSCFRIDERGRKYVKELEPSELGKMISSVLTLCLSILQLPFVIEGWISYFLHYTLKIISAIFFPIVLISFIWWPIDLLCGLCWMGCDWLKHIIWDKDFRWEVSSKRWTEHFPEL